MASSSFGLEPFPLPLGIRESYVHTHDLTYHILESGFAKNESEEKPLLLLIHGFPEIAYSWRKIMPGLANAGYHVVAYDQRGYGRTTGWDTRLYSEVDLRTFSMTILTRDAMVLINALGYNEVACVVGHDFGAVTASMCALMRPDIFKRVAIMAHPFSGSPKLPFNTISADYSPPVKGNVQADLASLPEPRKHYKFYYSTEKADDEMTNPKSEMHTFLRGYFHLKSADWDGNKPHPLKGWTASELATMPAYYVMPLHSTMREAVSAEMSREDPSLVRERSLRWLPDEELAVYAEEWSRTGFQGGLNWYRMASNPEYQKDVEVFAGRNIEVPCVYIAGKSDWATYQEPGAVDKMREVCEKFDEVYLVDGAGHWVQQEHPEQTLRILLDFMHY